MEGVRWLPDWLLRWLATELADLATGLVVWLAKGLAS